MGSTLEDMVVDKSGGAAHGRHGHHRSRGDGIDGLKGVRVHDLAVLKLDTRAPRDDRANPSLEGSVGAFAPRKCLLNGRESVEQCQCIFPLVTGKEDVSGAHGQTVGFPDHAPCPYLHTKLQVPDHAADQDRLLEILLAKDRQLRTKKAKQPGHDR